MWVQLLQYKRAPVAGIMCSIFFMQVFAILECATVISAVSKVIVTKEAYLKWKAVQHFIPPGY